MPLVALNQAHNVEVACQLIPALRELLLRLAHLTHSSFAPPFAAAVEKTANSVQQHVGPLEAEAPPIDHELEEEEQLLPLRKFADVRLLDILLDEPLHGRVAELHVLSIRRLLQTTSSLNCLSNGLELGELRLLLLH